MTPLHDNGADWTPSEDAAIAAREAAKMRVFDAHREDEPHWQDDDATLRRKGITAMLPVLCLFAFAVWCAL